MRESQQTEITTNKTNEFINCWQIFGRKFLLLIALNFLYLLLNLPSIIVATLVAKFCLPYYFSALNLHEFINNLLGTSIHAQVADLNTAAYSIFLIFCLLIFVLALQGSNLITTGPSQAAFAYILRNFAREEHVFFWTDLWQQLSENFKQALINSMITAVVTCLSLVALLFYLVLEASLIKSILLVLLCFFILLLIVMQNYIYQMLVTFDLNLFALWKNALFLCLANLPQTVIIILQKIICLELIPILCLVFLPINIGLATTIVYLTGFGFAFDLYFSNYIVNKVIKRFMMPTA